MTGLSSGRGVLGGGFWGTSSAFDWDSTAMVASPPSAGDGWRWQPSIREGRDAVWEGGRQYPEHGAAQSMWPDGRDPWSWDGWGPPALLTLPSPQAGVGGDPSRAAQRAYASLVTGECVWTTSAERAQADQREPVVKEYMKPLTRRFYYYNAAPSALCGTGRRLRHHPPVARLQTLKPEHAESPRASAESWPGGAGQRRQPRWQHQLVPGTRAGRW